LSDFWVGGNEERAADILSATNERKRYTGSQPAEKSGTVVMGRVTLLERLRELHTRRKGVVCRFHEPM